jgi:hypothetical protein
MLKKIFKRGPKKTQKYDIVAGPNSLPVSVSTDGDKNIFNVSVDGWSEEEKKELFTKATEKSDMTAYEGHIEHAYSRRHAYQTEKCPRCGADTRQQYGNFIYATQIAPRVMFAPAGYFCTECPTVIIDEDIVRNGITDRRFKFLGVIGIDYGKERKPDLFDTWNGQESVYVFNEDQQPMGISTYDPDHSSPQILLHSPKKGQQRKKNRRKIANKSRRMNKKK